VKESIVPDNSDIKLENKILSFSSISRGASRLKELSKFLIKCSVVDPLETGFLEGLEGQLIKGTWLEADLGGLLFCPCCSGLLCPRGSACCPTLAVGA
jgi:hypothetical protein